MTHQAKQSLRQKIKKLRGNLSTSQRYDASIAVWLRILEQDFFIEAQHIALYMPIQGELDTNPILQTSARLGKNIYLPIVKSQASTLDFYHYTFKMKMAMNQYGILEPPEEASEYIEPQKLDLVFVPLVAFDVHCRRLGMGKGYYDRTFAFRQHLSKPMLVGLGYAFQEVPLVPNNETDIALDKVITHQTIFENPKA